MGPKIEHCGIPHNDERRSYDWLLNVVFRISSGKPRWLLFRDSYLSQSLSQHRRIYPKVQYGIAKMAGIRWLLGDMLPVQNVSKHDVFFIFR